MREIMVIERNTTVQNGRTVLWEKKYHGLLRKDGSFRLLACCGKRFPLSREPSERVIKQKNKAA